MPLYIRNTDFVSRRAKEALKELPSMGNHSRALLAMALAYDFPDWSCFSDAVTNTGVFRPFDQDLNRHVLHSRRFSQLLNLKVGLQIDDLEAQRILETLKPTHDFKRDPVPFSEYEQKFEGTPMFARTGICFGESTGPLMFTHRASTEFGVNERGEMQRIPFDDEEPVDLQPLYVASAYNGSNTFFRFSDQPMSTETLSALIDEAKRKSKTAPRSVALTAKDAKEFPQIRIAALQHFKDIDPKHGRAVSRANSAVADNFLWSLGEYCKDLFEEMPTISELAGKLFDPRGMLPGNGLFVLEHPSMEEGDRNLGNAFARIHLAKYIARRVCILRKRDPNAGFLKAETVPYTCPRNNSTGLAPEIDPLEAAIELAEVNDRIPLDPELTRSIAEVFMNFRNSGSGDEEQLLTDLEREVAPLVFGALALEKIARSPAIIPVGYLGTIFGKRSQEMQLIDRAVGRILGRPLVHDVLDLEARLFALRLTMTDPSRSLVGLKGLPAHNDVQDAIRRHLFPKARVAIDTVFHNPPNSDGAEYYWRRHLGFSAYEMTRFNQWGTAGRTPYTRSNGMQSNHPICLSKPAQYIINGCAYGRKGSGAAEMLEPLGALLAECSAAVNQVLQHWETGLHCTFEAVLAYNEFQHLEDTRSRQAPPRQLLRFDAPHRVQ